MDNILRLFHGLCFCNPEGSLRHGDGKIVNLDPVELVNVDLDRRVLLEAEGNLSVKQLTVGLNLQPENFVLQAAKR